MSSTWAFPSSRRARRRNSMSRCTSRWGRSFETEKVAILSYGCNISLLQSPGPSNVYQARQERRCDTCTYAQGGPENDPNRRDYRCGHPSHDPFPAPGRAHPWILRERGTPPRPCPRKQGACAFAGRSLVGGRLEQARSQPVGGQPDTAQSGPRLAELQHRIECIGIFQSAGQYELGRSQPDLGLESEPDLRELSRRTARCTSSTRTASSSGRAHR